MTLLESYKDRLAVSENMYRNANNGSKMNTSRKICIAQCLENVNKFLTENFNSSVGTQRSDLGLYKKFCLNLVTCALPNLIAPEVVVVSPMTSMSGNIAYVKYVSANTKGATTAGTLLNDPFRLGSVDPNFTSDRIAETHTAVENDGVVTITLDWAPIVDGSVILKVGTTAVTDFTVDTATGVVTINAGASAGDDVKALYSYDNFVVPQAKLPMLRAEMANIPLQAKARRIAIYYSNLAAYQAKQDYGFDLGDQLAEKAVGQIQWEIDTEVTNLLSEIATEEANLVWSKTLPIGVSKQEHYAGFSEILTLGTVNIYKKTKRYSANYIICAPDVISVLQYVPGFQAAAGGIKNGPYFAGTVNGLKIFVTPEYEDGKFVIGVNGDALEASAAVYAPYMPVVPTQLLQYADGGTSQGWSTLYDLKPLNADLVVSGRICN